MSAKKKPNKAASGGPSPRACSAPLESAVIDGKLVISIGVETLAWASRPENGGPLETCEVEEGWESQFARDVAYEIVREEENGESPMCRFLDRMMQSAADNGSESLRFPQRKSRQNAPVLAKPGPISTTESNV